ncbi:MAG: LysR family transcriptional regulator [Pseudomonadota bacterium]|nr:LysR family transcriptional regulator [Pseudomonadota bacterium]
MDIERADLNTLVVFDALMQHQSVTRAGQALGLSQPAMSAALAKLRGQLGDPLFVRTGRGMRPTPRALQLADPVRRVLETVRTEILQRPAFDPALGRRAFTIITPDIGEVVFLPKMLTHVARHAPGVTFRSVAIPSPGAREALETGAADLAVGYFPDLVTTGFYQQRLFTNSFVCIVRADHPHARRQLGLSDFLSAGHALVRPAGRTHLFEQFLGQQGIKLDVRVQLSHFTSLLTIIGATNLIATVPLDIGHVFARLANVRLVKPPIQPPPFDVKQHWHERVHADAANVWLRRTIRHLFHD